MKITNLEVELLGSYGSDLEVVNAARVSFHKRANTMSPKDEKLIKYLAEHKHHSPFNHAFLSFRVKAPIFVARQLVKHKFMPWNEVSRRYVDDEPEFYFPDYWRKKADNVKQGSGDERCEYMYEEQWDGTETTYPYATPDELLHRNVQGSLLWYEAMIRNSVCPEQARMVLPQNTMTEWVWSGTLGAFLDMLVLRLDGHTQKETREVAEKIAVFVKNLFPVSYGAYIHA